MIDPISAFAVLKTATNAIQEAVKVGKDLSQIGGHVAKWANAEANLDVAASKKGTLVGKVFGKFSATEQNAIEAHFRKEELRRMRKEMREIFLLYGSAGQWERLQAEIAEHRAKKKEQLREMERIARRNRDLIVLGIALLIVGVGGYYYARYLLEFKGII